jgi:arylsulfatase
VLQGRRGDAVERVADYDLDMRRGIDNLITEKAENYIRRQAGEKRPFFLLVSFTQPHSPPLPHPDFNRPGRSDYQNTLMEIDHNAGRVLDAIDAAGITDNTLVIWASDNGPETLQGIGIQYGGQSDSGPFRGEFPSAWEGAVRVPAILRWPGRIEAGRASNEIVSILDFYATLAGFAGAGAKIPTDRPIDSIDLGDFLLGRASNSPREHVMFFYNQEMMAVKWRNYKVHFAVKVPSRSSVVAAGQGVLTAYHQTSGHPMVFDLENDPKELWNINGANQWLSSALAPVMRDYAVSLQRHPNIRPGQADGPGRR